MTVPICYERINAVPVILTDHKHLHLYLIGCGGTGGWLVQTLSRLTKILTDQARSVSLTLIDPDIVEKVNIPRQNFTQADLGLNKAQVLALRYGMAYGVDVKAIPERFEPEMVRADYNSLRIIIGSVDNAAARSAIALTLQENPPNAAPQVLWLDGGNTHTQGQVLLGSWSQPGQNPVLFAHIAQLDNGSSSLRPIGCVNLPGPSIQHPELLEPLPEESEDHNLSCEELASRNAQSLLINQRVAVEMGEYLVELLLVKNLRRFATYFDLETGSSLSRFTNPEILKTFINH